MYEMIEFWTELKLNS